MSSVTLKCSNTDVSIELPRHYIKHFSALEPLLAAMEETHQGPHCLDIPDYDNGVLNNLKFLMTKMDEGFEMDEYIEYLDDSTLSCLFIFSDFLYFKLLMDKCVVALSERLIGASAEKIEELTGLKNDYTPEEQREVKKQTQWGECIFPEQWNNFK